MLKKINEIKAINLKLLCSILVILIPPSLITGPLFSDLFLSISCILFIIILYKEKKFYYFNNFFFKFFVFFWIYLIFNSLFSDNIFHSLKVSIFYIRFGIFCILVNFLICEYEKFLNNFFYVLLFTISFVVFDGFFQYFLGFNLLGFETIDYPRISGMFGEESILGSYISRLIPILVAFFFINKFNKSRIIVFLLLIVLCQVLVVLTGERTAAGIIILSTIFFVIFIKDIRILKSIGFIITIVAAATFIFLNLNNDIKKRIIDTTLMELGVSENKQVQITFEGVQPIYKNYYLFSPKHQSMYLTSFNMFKDKKSFYRFFIQNLKKFSY